MSEDTFSSMADRGPPPNWHFDYRHIRHIGNPLQYGSEDEFKASVIKKFQNIDAGLNPDGTEKRRPRGAPPVPLAQRRSRTLSEVERENEELRKKLAALQADPEQARIDAVGRGEEEPETVIALKDEDPSPPAEAAPKVNEEDLTGKGPCPYCGKEWKQRQLHIPRCPQGPKVPVQPT